MNNGKLNKLKVGRIDVKGYYLMDDKGEEIFLSKEKEENSTKVGDEIEVFIYKDKHRIITRKKPFAQLEEFAFLKVKSISEEGALVDWGLETDLLVPKEEHLEKLQEDSSYMFFVFEDEDSGQLLGSQRVDDFVFFDEIDVEKGDEVKLLLYRETDLGINAIVNNLFKGLIFKSDIHKSVKPGDQIKGYVKQVREDGKIDLLLEPLGYKKSVISNTQAILNALNSDNNFLALTDKSSPDEVKSVLGLSKKAFKRAIGHLYKEKKIDIRENGIYLLKK